MISIFQSYAIEVCELTKRYGHNIACDRISLSVRPGTTFGLLGPNGAGKSSLIRMLMGLTASDSGQATILGYEDPRLPELRRQVGYVPETHFIYRWMTVREVLQFVSQLYQSWDAELANSLIEKFQLPLSKRVSALSKGMTAKLGLLLALSYHPQLLILDEPTSGLDPIIREDFLTSVLQSNVANGRTVLFSSHHVDDVERVSDEIGIIVGGRLVVQGRPDVLREQYKRIRAVLQDGKLPQFVPPETIIQNVARREWQLTVNQFSKELMMKLQSGNDLVSIDVIDLNLEEIFKDVVRGLSQKAVK